MSQLDLFEFVDDYPYPAPCTYRDRCGAYRCETGGCDGSRAWCTTGQLAAGRILPDWRRALMSDYQIRAYERDGLL